MSINLIQSRLRMNISNISFKAKNKNKTIRTKKVLLVVLPYLVKIDSSLSNTKKKLVRSFLAFPYGVLTVGSYIKKNCINKPIVEILDLNITSDDIAEDILNQKLLNFKPDIVGFSMSYDVSFKWLDALSTIVKRYNKDIKVVAGGPAVTTAYEEILDRAKFIDALCYSEGEKGLKNLVEADDESLELLNAPWVSKATINKDKKPDAIYEDLDEVVDVDYGLVDVSAYSMKEAFSPFTKNKSSSKQFFIVTSRGCPFKCVFCAEPSFHGANMRYVSVDNVVDHIGRLIDKYGLNVLTIYDDQILMNKNRAKELFEKLAKYKIRIEMPNGVTMSYIDEEMAYLMRQAGVDTIFLAIESGVKRVLHDIIKKPLAFDRVKPTIDILHKNDIFVCSFFVFGLPGETDEERIQNREFILDVGIDWSFFNYATPLRGSELFRQAKQNKWVDEKYLKLGEVDLTDYILRVPGMSPEKVKEDMFFMNLDVNFVNNRRMRVGDYDTAIFSFNEVISRHADQPFAHYFISEAYKKRGLTDDFNKANFHFNRYLELISADKDWFDYANKFHLKMKKLEEVSS